MRSCSVAASICIYLTPDSLDYPIFLQSLLSPRSRPPLTLSVLSCPRASLPHTPRNCTRVSCLIYRFLLLLRRVRPHPPSLLSSLVYLRTQLSLSSSISSIRSSPSLCTAVCVPDPAPARSLYPLSLVTPASRSIVSVSPFSLVFTVYLASRPRISRSGQG